MSVKEWIIIGSVVVVLLAASIASLFGAMNMTSNAMAGTQPYIKQLYSATTPDQEAVLEGVSQCMTHYSKIDPAVWGQTGFDPTPLSSMDETKRNAAVALIRTKLEAPCVAYGKFSAQRPGSQGPAVYLTADQYMATAAELGMDAPAAEKWFQQRLNR